MPNPNFSCGIDDQNGNQDEMLELELVECQLSQSKCCNNTSIQQQDPNANSNRKNCRFAFASWCPVCEIHLQRKRSKSESNDILNRKRNRDNLKTFTPKKNDRHRYCTENKSHIARDRDMKLDSSRVRTNLCELPNSYHQNCQNTVPSILNREDSPTNKPPYNNNHHIDSSEFQSFLLNSPPISGRPETQKYLPVKSLDLSDRVHRHITFSAPAETQRDILKQNPGIVPKSPQKIQESFLVQSLNRKISPNPKNPLQTTPKKNLIEKSYLNGVIKKTDSTARPLIAKFEANSNSNSKKVSKIHYMPEKAPNHINKFSFVQNENPSAPISNFETEEPKKLQSPYKYFETAKFGNKNSNRGPRSSPFGSKNTNFDSRTHNFGSRSPDLRPKSPDFCSKNSDFYSRSPGTKSPEFGTKSLDFRTKSPDFGTKSPDFGTKSPDFGTKSPDFGTKSPDFGTKSPDFGSKSPELSTRNPVPNRFVYYNSKRPKSPNFCSKSPNFVAKSLDSEAKSSNLGTKSPDFELEISESSVEKPNYNKKSFFGTKNTNFVSKNSRFGANSPNLGTKSPEIGTKSNLGSKSPGLRSKTPNLGSRSPNFGTKSPELGTKSPEIGTKSPEIGTKSPVLGTRNSERGTKSPGFGIKIPDFGTRSSERGTKSPGFGTKSPDFGTRSSERGTKSPGFGTRGPDLGTSSSERETKSPGFGTKSPVLGTSSESGTKHPELGTKSSELGTKTPEHGTKNPELGTKNPELGTKNSELGTTKTTFPNLEIKSPGTKNPELGSISNSVPRTPTTDPQLNTNSSKNQTPNSNSNSETPRKSPITLRNHIQNFEKFIENKIDIKNHKDFLEFYEKSKKLLQRDPIWTLKSTKTATENQPQNPTNTNTDTDTNTDIQKIKNLLSPKKEEPNQKLVEKKYFSNFTAGPPSPKNQKLDPTFEKRNPGSHLGANQIKNPHLELIEKTLAPFEGPRSPTGKIRNRGNPLIEKNSPRVSIPDTTFLEEPNIKFDSGEPSPKKLVAENFGNKFESGEPNPRNKISSSPFKNLVTKNQILDVRPESPELDINIAVELNNALSPLKNSNLNFEPLTEAKKLLQKFSKMPEPLKLLEPSQIMEPNQILPPLCDPNLDFCDLKRQRVRQRTDSNSSEQSCENVQSVGEKIVKKKAREVSPTEICNPNGNNKSQILNSKSAVKFPTKPRHKLSSVKLRKVRSKIAHSVSSDSNLSESDASETEEEDPSEDNLEFKSAIPNEKDIKIGATPIPKTTIQPVAVEHPTLGKWPVRNSLFPHVPAYITFNAHDQDPFILPPGVGKHLKWRLSTITPVLVRKTLINTGFRLVKSESIPESNDWIGCWGKHMKSVCFQTLTENQKLNHFPGTFQIGRKDRLWKNLQRLMFKFGHKEFGFIPRTYVLPQDLKQLRNAWEKTGQERWIIKPPASARGTGIKVIHRWAHLPKKKYLVVQQYISNPYLINGSKFDLRLYVLVTSFNPLRIYLYPDGLVRFASTKYSDDINSLSDRYMHLTNYSINKLSSQYTANEDANACKGHKWTLHKLWEYFEQRNIDTKALWNNLQQLVIKTIIAGESSISQLIKGNVNSRYNCYELFGIDVLLDERLKPWLLEVNISPSLHSASPLDLHVKGPLVQTLLNLAQFHLPTKLQKMRKSPLCLNTDLYVTRLTMKEHCKHSNYLEYEDRKDYLDSILKDLTGDDVRHLIQAEDELTVIGNFERIFPTKHTHEYFQFMEPRYYNKLFDAWEHKYQDNRQPGIKRLQGLCEQRLHLMIAPVPVTKDEEKDEKKEIAILDNTKAQLSILSNDITSILQNVSGICDLAMGDHTNAKPSPASEKIQTIGDLFNNEKTIIN